MLSRLHMWAPGDSTTPFLVMPLRSGTWRWSTHRIPRRLKKVSRSWLLLRDSIMWLLWLELNDAVLNSTFWSKEKMYNKIWLHMVDYGRIAWQQVKHWCKPKHYTAILYFMHITISVTILSLFLWRVFSMIPFNINLL